MDFGVSKIIKENPNLIEEFPNKIDKDEAKKLANRGFNFDLGFENDNLSGYDYYKAFCDNDKNKNKNKNKNNNKSKINSKDSEKTEDNQEFTDIKDDIDKYYDSLYGNNDDYNDSDSYSDCKSDCNDKSSENNDDSDDEYIKLRPKTLEELIQERNIIDENYGMISENEKSLNQYAKEKLKRMKKMKKMLKKRKMRKFVNKKF